MKTLADYLYHETEHGILYCGDCLEIMPLLADKSVDCVVTSPPYYKQLAYESNFNSYLQFVEWCDVWNKQIANAVKDGGYYFLNFANDKTNAIKAYEILNTSLKYMRLHDTIIWYRYNSQPVNTDRQLTPQYEFVYMMTVNTSNYHLNKELLLKELPDLFDTKNVGNVWKLAFNKDKDREFSMKKQNEDASNGLWGHSGFPVDLPKACILLTTKENDTVLDLFSGSGTTAVASIQTKRKYIAIEKNAEFCEYAKRRIESALDQLEISI